MYVNSSIAFIAALLVLPSANRPEVFGQDGRQLAGTITVDGIDHETVGKNDTIHCVFPINLQLNKEKPEVDLKIRHVKWGGECRVECDLKASLLANNRICITGTIKLFEGEREDTNDLEDTKKVDIEIVRGGKLVQETITVLNPGFSGSDKGTVSFALTNAIIEDDEK